MNYTTWWLGDYKLIQLLVSPFNPQSLMFSFRWPLTRLWVVSCIQDIAHIWSWCVAELSFSFSCNAQLIFLYDTTKPNNLALSVNFSNSTCFRNVFLSFSIFHELRELLKQFNIFGWSRLLCYILCKQKNSDSHYSLPMKEGDFNIFLTISFRLGVS